MACPPHISFTPGLLALTICSRDEGGAKAGWGTGGWGAGDWGRGGRGRGVGKAVTSSGGNWCVGEMYTRLGDDQGDPRGPAGGEEEEEGRGGAEEGGGGRKKGGEGERGRGTRGEESKERALVAAVMRLRDGKACVT